MIAVAGLPIVLAASTQSSPQILGGIPELKAAQLTLAPFKDRNSILFPEQLLVIFVEKSNGT